MNQLHIPGCEPPPGGDCWQTPLDFLELVRRVGPIKLDPCTLKSNPTGAEYIRTEQCDPDGLETEWHTFGGLVFVNPPYSDPLPWAAKIVTEASLGTEVLALMPGDTSTVWARMLLATASRVAFPKRIKFRGANGASPNFWNAVYYFGPRPQTFRRVFRAWPVVQPMGAP